MCGIELLVLALRAPNYKAMIQLAGGTDGYRRQQHKIQTAHPDPSNGKHVRANAHEEEVEEEEEEEEEENRESDTTNLYHCRRFDKWKRDQNNTQYYAVSTHNRQGNFR